MTSITWTALLAASLLGAACRGLPDPTPATEPEPSAPTVRRSFEVTEPQVTGLVLDEHGAPVPGVVVQARRTERGPPCEIRADELGRFAFDGLEPGWWFFSVDDMRFARMWWRENGAQITLSPTWGMIAGVDASQVRKVETVTVRLHEPRSAEGLVIDEAGGPVGGALVRLATEWLPGAKTPVQGHLTHVLQEWHTAPDGRFTMQRLRPGKMSAVLDHPGFARTIARFSVPGEPARLTIKRGLVMEGQVLLDGQPLAGVRVQANGPGLAKLSMGKFSGTTDEQGHFRFEHVASFAEHSDHTPTLSIRVDDPAYVSPWQRIYESSTEPGLPFIKIDAIPRSEASEEASFEDARSGAERP